MNIRKAMSVSVPLKPPFKPCAFVAAVVLIIDAETFYASSKIVNSSVHHVYMILGDFVEKKRRRWRWWGVRLPDHALTGMLTYIVLLSRFITIKIVVTFVTGRSNLLSKEVFWLIVRDWRSA